MSERELMTGRLSPEGIEQNFSDPNPPLTELQAVQESARCLFCFDAPCTEACPTGIDIPGFIRKIATGNLRGAAITILDENIMGSTCASVCPVEELCEQVCVKNSAEQKPVTIGRLQRYATDHLFQSRQQPYRRGPETGRHVAVVGAGPAGLACAHSLARRGHQVNVFEACAKAGGLNEYGIAAYKLLDERAAREVEFILAVGGITLVTGQRLGADLALDDLRNRYDAVFLGLGHNAVNALGLANEEVGGVHNAVDFIREIRQRDKATLPVGRRVVVIGGGNTAIDIAVQVKKLGAESVTLVYRRGRSDMGATAHEQQFAQTNGVLIRTGAQPVAIHAEKGAVTGVGFEYTRYAAGQRPAGSDDTFVLPADQLFKAIGQTFVPAPFQGSEAPHMEAGRIVVDPGRQSSLPDVWAGGDCVPGQDLTVVAVQDGKLAADSIHRFLES